jgi:glutamate transport system substrate-binding protein
MSDLTGERVCTISASTSVKAPQAVQAFPVPRNRISECIDDLRKGSVTAVTTDAAILAGWKARFRTEFDHWDVGLDPNEAWGINVGDNPALQKLVDLTLYRSYADPKDNRWEEAYAANFQSEVSANKQTPIAVAEQPRVEKPDIRDLPWEDVLP